jgi:hypothetical protein
MGTDQPPRQAWIISIVSLALSYAVAALTPINQWIALWLRESFYIAYQLFLMGMLLPCGVYLAARYHKRSDSALAMTVWGALLGYPAGLIALLFHPLVLPHGGQIFVESLRITTPEAVIAVLWFPVRLLSWLYGGMLGLFVPVVSHAVGRLQAKGLLKGA